MIQRSALLEAAQALVKLASHYKGAPQREMRVDGLVYGYLNAKFGVRRQHQVRKKSGSGKPERIDFKQGGTNPVVIEFAVRTREHLNELYGSQNKSELKKLAKQTRMKARYLLLLDLSGEEGVEEGRLEATYSKINAGRGRFPRSSVRVIYVHPDVSYHFIWRPLLNTQ